MILQVALAHSTTYREFKMALMKIKRRYTVLGAAASGTAFFSVAGGNTPVALYADASGTKKFESSTVALDADGVVEVYVVPGEYRIVVKNSSGSVLAQDDQVASVQADVTAERLSDEPSFQSIPYAAAITPKASQPVTYVQVGTLTGAITINAPKGAEKGYILVFSFAQDATGGRAITWDAAFSKAADSGSTASHVAATSFVYNGSKWLQLGNAMTFHAA